ncbi:MAG: hypothetical protein JNN07_09010 [Verrucomicrobiales bacterium]|nr:hypothetical protein [Verrucomicrobiales bacterium]
MVDFLMLGVLALSAFLAWRWRLHGTLISILFGWFAIQIILMKSAGPQDWEIREDWPNLGGILIGIWSFGWLGISQVVCWVRHRRPEHPGTRNPGLRRISLRL